MAAAACVFAANASSAAAQDVDPAQPGQVSAAEATGDQDGQVTDIIVTANRVEQRLQDVASSVSAISADTLESMNARDLYDISRAAPNIQFAGTQGGAGLGTLTIRGIGQQQAGLLSDPGAAVYVDEVYRPRLSSNTLTFTDITRVEVLRGPQGTLYGKNTIGGALNVYTGRPEQDFSANGLIETGSRDLIRVAATVNAPLVEDVLAMRLSAEHVAQDGYVDNLETGEELSDTNFYSVRGSIALTPRPELEFILRADITEQDQQSPGTKVLSIFDPLLLTEGGYQTRGTAETYNRGHDQGVSLTASWDSGAGMLRSITAYRDFLNEFAEDTDGTPLLLQHISAVSSEKSFSQELQYNFGLFDDRARATIGAFYMHSDIEYDSFPRLAPFALDNYSDQMTESYALFGQLDFNVTDRLELSAGVRYSRDDKETSYESTFVGAPGPAIDETVEDSWEAVTPRFTVQYDFTPNVMVYAGVSVGFKSGGMNGQPIIPSDFAPFDQETATNYEVGIKSELFDRRVRANLSVYRMDYEDIQVAITSGGSNMLENAGAAELTGIEAELVLRPTRLLTLSGAYALNEFEYTELDADALASGLTYDNVLPVSPRETLNLGAEYVFPLGSDRNLTVRTDYAWRSKVYFNAINTESIAQDDYGLLSARISLNLNDSVEIYAYGNNLEDEYYRVAATADFLATVAMPGRPQEFGLGVRAKF